MICIEKITRFYFSCAFLALVFLFPTCLWSQQGDTNSIKRVNDYIAHAFQCRREFAQEGYPGQQGGALTFWELAQFEKTDHIIHYKGAFYKIRRVQQIEGERRLMVQQVWGPYKSYGTSTLSNVSEEGFTLVGSPAHYQKAMKLRAEKYPKLSESENQAIAALFALNTLKARSPDSMGWKPDSANADNWSPFSLYAAQLLEKLGAGETYLRSFENKEDPSWPQVAREIGESSRFTWLYHNVFLRGGAYDGIDRIEDIKEDPQQVYAAVVRALAASLIKGPATGETYNMIAQLWKALLLTTGVDIIKAGIIRNFSPKFRFNSLPLLGLQPTEYYVAALGGKVKYVPPDCEHISCVDLWRNSGERFKPTTLPLSIQLEGPPLTFHPPLEDEPLDQVLAWEENPLNPALPPSIAETTYTSLASHLEAIAQYHSGSSIVVTHLPLLNRRVSIASELAEKITKEHKWKSVSAFRLSKKVNPVYDGTKVGTWQSLVHNSQAYINGGVKKLKDTVVVLVGGAYREGVAVEWARMNLIDRGVARVYVVTAGQIEKEFSWASGD